MEPNKENIRRQREYKKKRKNSSYFTESSKRVKNHDTNAQISLPKRACPETITKNRLTTKVGLLSHIVEARPCDKDTPVHKKGPKDKLKSICSNYFQKDSRCRGSNSELHSDIVEDLNSPWPDHLTRHQPRLDVDQCADEIVSGLQSIELSSYINPIKSRIQRKYFESCRAYQKLCRDQKYTTPFSEQVTPQINEDTGITNVHENNRHRLKDAVREMDIRFNRSAQDHNSPALRFPMLHPTSVSVKELATSDIENDYMKDLFFNIGSNDRKSVTMSILGEFNQSGLMHDEDIADPTRRFIYNLESQTNQSSSNDHNIIEKTIDFLKLLDNEAKAIEPKISGSVQFSGKQEQPVIQDWDAKIKYPNTFARMEVHSQTKAHGKISYPFDGASENPNCFQNFKKLAESSSLWDGNQMTELDKLFKSPSPKPMFDPSKKAPTWL